MTIAAASRRATSTLYAKRHAPAARPRLLVLPVRRPRRGSNPQVLAAQRQRPDDRRAPGRLARPGRALRAACSPSACRTTFPAGVSADHAARRGSAPTPRPAGARSPACSFRRANTPHQQRDASRSRPTSRRRSSSTSTCSPGYTPANRLYTQVVSVWATWSGQQRRLLLASTSRSRSTTAPSRRRLMRRADLACARGDRDRAGDARRAAFARERPPQIERVAAATGALSLSNSRESAAIFTRRRAWCPASRSPARSRSATRGEQAGRLMLSRARLDETPGPGGGQLSDVLRCASTTSATARRASRDRQDAARLYTILLHDLPGDAQRPTASRSRSRTPDPRRRQRVRGRVAARRLRVADRGDPAAVPRTPAAPRAPAGRGPPLSAPRGRAEQPALAPRCAADPTPARDAHRLRARVRALQRALHRALRRARTTAPRRQARCSSGAACSAASARAHRRCGRARASAALTLAGARLRRTLDAAAASASHPPPSRLADPRAQHRVHTRPGWESNPHALSDSRTKSTASTTFRHVGQRPARAERVRRAVRDRGHSALPHAARCSPRAARAWRRRLRADWRWYDRDGRCVVSARAREGGRRRRHRRRAAHPGRAADEDDGRATWGPADQIPDLWVGCFWLP